ncbi:MAG: hypothetical protein ACQEP1_03165 [Nanobdellota archaeon]
MRKIIARIKDNLDKTEGRKIKQNSYIFSFRKGASASRKLDTDIKQLKEKAWSLEMDDKDKHLKILNKVHLIEKMHSEDTREELKKALDELSMLLPEKKDDYSIPKTLPVPGAIKDEMIADLQELRECFNYGLYRSSIILCGRMLEVALHRKYYEITGKDILETNPGIGLGKLVAKLNEKKALFEPGINEQIHLINKVRIHSVHKKKEVFSTTKHHTYATILYTTEIIKKLFS